MNQPWTVGDKDVCAPEEDEVSVSTERLLGSVTETLLVDVSVLLANKLENSAAEMLTIIEEDKSLKWSAELTERVGLLPKLLPKVIAQNINTTRIYV